MDKNAVIGALVVDLCEQLRQLPEQDLARVGAHLLGVVNGVRIAEEIRSAKTA